MKTFLAICAASLALAGCTTAQSLSAHQTAEKALILSDDLYVAIASFANAQETAQQWPVAKGEALKQEAYAALLRARALYEAGQAVDLTPLEGLARQNGVPVSNGVN